MTKFNDHCYIKCEHCEKVHEYLSFDESSYTKVHGGFN